MIPHLRLVSVDEKSQLAALAALDGRWVRRGLLSCRWEDIDWAARLWEPSIGLVAMLAHHPDPRATLWVTRQDCTPEGRLPDEAYVELCHRAQAAGKAEDLELRDTLWNSLALAAEYLGDPAFYRVVTSIPAGYLGYLAERYSGGALGLDKRNERCIKRLRAIMHVAFKRKEAGEGWDSDLESTLLANVRYFRGSRWLIRLATSPNEKLAAAALLRTLHGSRYKRGLETEITAKALRVATLILPRVSFSLPKLLAQEVRMLPLPGPAMVLVTMARLVAAASKPGDEDSLETSFMRLSRDISMRNHVEKMMVNALGTSAKIGGLLSGASDREIEHFLTKKDSSYAYKYAVIGALKERHPDAWEGVSFGGMRSTLGGMRGLWSKIRETTELHPAFGAYGGICGCCLDDINKEAWSSLERRGYKSHVITDPMALSSALRGAGATSTQSLIEAYGLGSGLVLHVSLRREGQPHMIVKIVNQEVVGVFAGSDVGMPDMQMAQDALVEAGLVANHNSV